MCALICLISHVLLLFPDCTASNACFILHESCVHVVTCIGLFCGYYLAYTMCITMIVATTQPSGSDRFWWTEYNNRIWLGMSALTGAALLMGLLASPITNLDIYMSVVFLAFVIGFGLSCVMMWVALWFVVRRIGADADATWLRTLDSFRWFLYLYTASALVIDTLLGWYVASFFKLPYQNYMPRGGVFLPYMRNDEIRLALLVLQPVLICAGTWYIWPHDSAAPTAEETSMTPSRSGMIFGSVVDDADIGMDSAVEDESGAHHQPHPARDVDAPAPRLHSDPS